MGKFAVRATGQSYEVYEISTEKTVERFTWKNENSRAVAMGKANCTRSDLNQAARAA